VRLVLRPVNTSCTAVDSALEGFSATAFAYGQTGSGKTYTMTGRDDGGAGAGGGGGEIDGITPRSMRYLFDETQQRQAAGTARYTIRASFLEVYNEQVRDLWNLQSKRLVVGSPWSQFTSECQHF
jgi:kinesin family protein 12